MKQLLILLCTICWFASAQATDYSFGGDTLGTDVYGWADSCYYLDTVTSPANTGTLDSIIWWMKDNYHGPHSVAGVVYSNDSTFLDSTAHITVEGSSSTRYKADFVEGGSISSETLYFIGLHLASEGGTDGSAYIACSTNVTPYWWYKSAQATIPATITAPTKASGYWTTIMVYYSDAASPSGQKVMLRQ